jgi:hypothetical protein
MTNLDFRSSPLPPTRFGVRPRPRVPPTAPPPSVRPRSAGFQPAVSPTSSRPRRSVRRAPAGWQPAIQQTRGLRYDVGATPPGEPPTALDFRIRHLESGIPILTPPYSILTPDWVGRRCAGAAHPAARQRGPTYSAGKPAHSKRCATDRAFDPRTSVWSAAACCRFLLGGTAYQAVVGSNLLPTRLGERPRPRVPLTAPPPSVRPRSAGFQPAVSPTSSRPRRSVRRAPAGWKPAIQQTRGLRYASTHRRLPAFGIRYLASGIWHPASPFSLLPPRFSLLTG